MWPRKKSIEQQSVIAATSQQQQLATSQQVSLTSSLPQQQERPPFISPFRSYVAATATANTAAVASRPAAVVPPRRPPVTLVQSAAAISSSWSRATKPSPRKFQKAQESSSSSSSTVWVRKPKISSKSSRQPDIFEIPKEVYRLPATWKNPVLPSLRPNNDKLVSELRVLKREYEKEDESNAALNSRTAATSLKSSGGRKKVSMYDESPPADETEIKEVSDEPHTGPAPLRLFIRKIDEISNHIRIRGNTRTGISCSVIVQDFQPHFFIAMPLGWLEDDIPAFQAALAARAAEIRKIATDPAKATGDGDDAKPRGRRRGQKNKIPRGVFPVPKCTYATGRSAFTWRSKPLESIRITCANVAVYRFYVDLLSNGKETAYQAAAEAAFAARDAEEEAKKSAKKAKSAASKKPDALQPKVGSWAGPAVAAVPVPLSQDNDAEEVQDWDDLDPEDPNADPDEVVNEMDRLALDEVDPNEAADEAGNNDSKESEDQQKPFKKEVLFNGLFVPDLPANEDTFSEMHTFEVHNNGWKMPIVFLAAQKMKLYSWIDLWRPYLMDPEVDGDRRLTTTQIEVASSVKQITADNDCIDQDHSFELTYDIECLCANGPGTFPKATRPGDLVNCITARVEQPGALVPQPPVTVAWALGTALPRLLPEVHYLLLFDAEEDQVQSFQEWRDVQLDTDKIISYNGLSFDEVYNFERAQILNLTNYASSMSDVRGRECKIRTIVRQAKQFGKEIFNLIDVPGRVQFDVMRVIPKLHKLDSYSLKFVTANISKPKESRAALKKRLYALLHAKPGTYINADDFKDESVQQPIEIETESPDELEFWRAESEWQQHRIAQWESLVTADDYAAWDKAVKSGKIDLPPERLFPFFMAGARGRTEIIRYCMRDTNAAYMLARDHLLILNYEAMAKLTHTDVDHLITKGEQVKVWNVYCQMANDSGWFLNRAFLREIMPVNRLLEKIKGGHVTNPKINFYSTDVTATLDFSSLYPSEGKENNLCSSTLAFGDEIDNASRDGFAVLRLELNTGEVLHFVQGCPSILPEFFGTLLAQRAATKKLMKTAKGHLYDVLDCRQLAEKLTNNCGFGFISAARGFASCWFVGAAITAMGRKHITFSAEIASSPPFNYNVIYGDTDSIMIQLTGVDIPPHEKTGDPELDKIKKLTLCYREACKVSTAITAALQNPEHVARMGPILSLTMEKLYYPYLLLGAKYYAALKWEYSEKDLKFPDPKVDTKGLATVRRSAVPFVRGLCLDMLHSILNFGDRDLALSILNNALVQLVQGKVPHAALIRTAKLAGNYGATTKVPHNEVKKKMERLDPATCPGVGSRVPYLMTLNGEKDQHKRAEHPSHVERFGYKLDLTYYLENQIENPVTGFMQWFMRDASVLFRDAKAAIYRETNHIHSIDTLFAKQQADGASSPMDTKDDDTRIVSYRNRTSMEQPSSSEIALKLKRNIKNKKKRGYETSIVTPKLDQWFHIVEKSI